MSTQGISLERSKRVLKATDSVVTRLTFWLTALKDGSSLWVPSIAVPVTLQPFPSAVGSCGGGSEARVGKPVVRWVPAGSGRGERVAVEGHPHPSEGCKLGSAVAYRARRAPGGAWPVAPAWGEHGPPLRWGHNRGLVQLRGQALAGASVEELCIFIY